MVKKLTDAVDKPSRRTVEQLFRDLERPGDSATGYDKCREADEVVDALEKDLLNVKTYRDAKASAERLRGEYCRRSKELKDKINKVRRMYLARGLTTAVAKAIEQLVEEVNG